MRARAGLTSAAAVTAWVVTAWVEGRLYGRSGRLYGAAACGGGGAGCGSVCTGETPAGARWRSNASTLGSRRCSKLPNSSTLTSATMAITGKASASRDQHDYQVEHRSPYRQIAMASLRASGGW